MMKSVRKKDRPVTTMLGGISWMDMALFIKERTMMIRVNEVMLRMMAGAKVKKVRNRTISTAELSFVGPEPVPKSTEREGPPALLGAGLGPMGATFGLETLTPCTLGELTFPTLCAQSEEAPKKEAEKIPKARMSLWKVFFISPQPTWS
jgi:hypothetical protein